MGAIYGISFVFAQVLSWVKFAAFAYGVISARSYREMATCLLR